MSINKKQVIIGNSAAGLNAVKSIRKRDRSCPITLISAEKCNAYSPVLLTYYISNKIPRENLFIVDENFYRNYNVTTIFGQRAIEIDRSKQVVYLENGNNVQYDNLLIATGASAKKIGDYSDDIFSKIVKLRTIEDANKIKRLSNESKEIVVVGAGLVSLQIINAIYKEKVKITVLVGSKQILSKNIDAECADIIQEKIQSNSMISFEFKRNIEKIERKKDKLWITLNTGEALKADMLVAGKGVSPNIELAKNGAIKTNTGILIDDYLRTNYNNIYAAGDVSEGKNMITGKSDVVPNWINACEQGEVAGLNMLGHQEKYKGSLNINITNMFDFTIASIGLSRPLDKNMEEIKLVDQERGIYRKFIIKDDMILGALLVGKIDDAGIIRSVVQNSVDITNIKKLMPKRMLNTAQLFL